MSGPAQCDFLLPVLDQGPIYTFPDHLHIYDHEGRTGINVLSGCRRDNGARRAEIGDQFLSYAF